ncbi:MAG TPA: hypothetical protein VHY35_15275 [Stellaceae bacterium]|jgi:hypothetical protein|nr:hypothetical protein [Stellaceae bacterium]
MFCYVVFVLLLSCIVPIAASNATELAPPFSDLSLREPDEPARIPPAVYDKTGPAPNWVVSQWSIPGGKLSAFVRSSGQDGDTIFHASAAAASVKVKRNGDHEVIDLAQNGTVLPCRNKSGTPRESDLFLSPAAPLRGKDAAQPYRLSELKSLHQTVDMTVTEGERLSGDVQSCDLNMGSALTSVILKDMAAKQTIFYQLKLNIVCFADTAAYIAKCRRKPARMAVFWGKPPRFGVDDFLPLLGEPFLQTGEARHSNVDLLPRLLTFVRLIPAIDQDLSHWTLSGIYIGQHIWGKVLLSTEWRAFNLTAVPN